MLSIAGVFVRVLSAFQKNYSVEHCPANIYLFKVQQLKHDKKL